MRALRLLMLVLIRGYQLLISPFFPPSCRYIPSCSEYARQAVVRHGPLRGGWLALRRLLRCHPWADWGYDPVPDAPADQVKGSRAQNAGTAKNSAGGLGLCADCRHLDH